ncbi:25835_t:CDS:2, partial [Dentiscutata erythropus]
EIENLKEYEIPDYKNLERLKSDFPNDLKQELKESHQKRLDFLKYLNEIQLNNEWTRKIKKKFEDYKNKFNNLRIGEIIDIIYNKVLNEINNIKNLEDFIINSYGHGKLTENILALDEQTSIDTKTCGGKFYLRNFEIHLNFVKFKLNDEKTFDKTSSFYTQEIKEYINKIISIHEENSIMYYQVIINKMNASTNKEDFKDWGDFDQSIKYLDDKYLKEKKPQIYKKSGKKNYKMSEPVIPPIIPEEDDRLLYEKIEITEDRLINGHKFQQETDTHTLDLVKEIWE